MPQREPVFAQLVFDLGSVNPRAKHSQATLGVQVDQPVHPAQVDGQSRPELFQRIDMANHAGSPSVRDQLDLVFASIHKKRADVSGCFRKSDGIRHNTELTAA